MMRLVFVGVLTAASGICPTTIGGGIYCNGNFTGIATFGNPDCGLVNSPSIYTQVSLTISISLIAYINCGCAFISR